MTEGEILVLALIIGMFVVFGVTLFWFSEEEASTRRSRRREHPAPQLPRGTQIIIDD